MVKYFIASSMIALLAVTLLAAVESFPADKQNMGKDIMNFMKEGMKALKSFKKEDIEEIAKSMKNKKDREILMKTVMMMIQGKSMGEVAEVLLEADCGATIAEKLAGLADQMGDLKEKYGKGLKEVAKQKKGT